LELAPRAAERAACLGAHREAASQYRRALQFAAATPAKTRAGLFESLSYELYLTADLDAALDARRAALEIYADDPVASADQLRWMSRISWYRGMRAEAEKYARRSTELLEPLGPSAELAMSFSNQSQLHMLSGRYRESIGLGQAALAIADRLGNVEIRVHALNNIGTSETMLNLAGGVERIEESLRLSLEHEMDDHAARAYVNLVGPSIDHHDGTLAERYLGDGLAYCAARQLDIQWGYLEANRARLLLMRGRWAEAEEVALALLDQPRLRLHRFVALLPLVLLRIRRGEPHEEMLAELVELAAQLDEPQRIVPALCARAEAAWLAGSLDGVRADLMAQAGRADAQEQAELYRWIAAADPAVVVPEGLAGPFAVQLTGTPREAAAAFSALENPYEAAVALLAGEEADIREALAAFRRLGAEPAVRLARARLRELGVSAVPRGPRRATADNRFGLTARENDVLQLLTANLTNAQIAQRLVLSERTVHHHVSSLLAKLQVPNRAAAAAIARDYDDGPAG
jgi:DNA-binding NarL/FixJ family response regulator